MLEELLADWFLCDLKLTTQYSRAAISLGFGFTHLPHRNYFEFKQRVACFFPDYQYRFPRGIPTSIPCCLPPNYFFGEMRKEVN